jgi:hypothetical protein
VTPYLFDVDGNASGICVADIGRHSPETQRQAKVGEEVVFVEIAHRQRHRSKLSLVAVKDVKGLSCE